MARLPSLADLALQDNVDVLGVPFSLPYAPVQQSAASVRHDVRYYIQGVSVDDARRRTHDAVVDEMLDWFRNGYHRASVRWVNAGGRFFVANGVDPASVPWPRAGPMARIVDDFVYSEYAQSLALRLLRERDAHERETRELEAILPDADELQRPPK